MCDKRTNSTSEDGLFAPFLAFLENLDKFTLCTLVFNFEIYFTCLY